ncbi:MAG: hypothetical protein AAFY17_16990 [Cyanobacteria bacterium J06642_11]
MLHGLLWLPLLIFFFWITWAGWNEYQKVETYKQWAVQFERAKFDILAALGQTERSLTWGVPTRQAIIDLQTVELAQLSSIDLIVKGDDGFAAAKDLAKKSEAFLQLQLTGSNIHQIPFTDVDLAQQWYEFLTKTLPQLRDPAH